MMNKEMKVLIMGGTQFVSRAVAKRLIQEGYTVDIFTRDQLEQDYHGVREHLVGDRNKDLDLKKILSKRKYDFVFDITAYTKEQAEKLINYLDRANLKRYIFCSSGGVYISSDKKLSEKAQRGATIWGKYGTDKMEIEDYLIKVNRESGFPCTIFRPTYIYGEGNNLSRETYFFQRILSDEPILVPDSKEKTQFIHIEDVVKTMISCLDVDKSIGQAYNLTDEQEFNWIELVREIFKASGKSTKVHAISEKEEKKLGIRDSREYFPFRDRTYLLSIEKISEHGLHVPKINIQEGLRRAFKWYIENPHELRDQRMIANVDRMVKEIYYEE